MKPVALIDLDNCISDDRWRWPMFDLHLPIVNERYQRYHAACEADLHDNSHVIQRLRYRYDLIVATSRPESVRHKTQLWLRKWNIPTKRIFMRPDDNHQPSPTLKAWMLDQAREEGFNVHYAIDDRADILDMYADEGVRICRRVFINNIENIHP